MMMNFSNFINLPKIISILFMLFPISANADLSRDMRLSLSIISKDNCVFEHAKLLSRNTDAVIIVLGPTLIDENFVPKNSKQRKFIQFLNKSGDLIEDKDKETLLVMVLAENCAVDTKRITDPVYRAMLQSQYQKRENFADRLKRNEFVRYADFTEILKLEAKLTEEFLGYWIKSDPNSFNSLQNEFQNYMEKLMKGMKPLLTVLVNEYGIE